MKIITRRLLAFVCLALFLLSILVAVKPGASFFYFKQTIDKKSITPDDGHAYRIALKASSLLFRRQDALIFEDGIRLRLSESHVVADSGNGTYALSEPSQGAVYVYFSPIDNTDPLAGRQEFSLYLPFRFITRPLGILYILILLPGLAGYLYFALANPDRRKTLTSSRYGILFVLDRFFDHISNIATMVLNSINQNIITRKPHWKNLFTLIIAASYFYVLMEWGFYVTKPSFLSVMNLSSKLEILLLSGLGLALLCIVVFVVYLVLDLIAITARISWLTRYVGILIPTLELSAISLLLIDNFTYTVFKFGIITSGGVWRGVYGLLFVLLVIIIYKQILKYTGLNAKDSSKEPQNGILFYSSIIILGISIILVVTQFNYKLLTSSSDATLTSPISSTHPNIILLSGDGLSAENLSAYGYKRDTTPRLRELAQNSLLAENAFPNGGTTTASEVSILTGKLPTATHFGFQFDKLSGINAYQHLPGILKIEGYMNVEFGIPTLLDANNFNLLNGFDIVNGKSQSEDKFVSLLGKMGFDNPGYFLNMLAGRISERILHIYYIRNMQNPYLLVTQPASWLSDKEKIDQMLSMLDQSEKPMFFHVHLLGTHGPKYKPTIQYYSKGETQDQLLMEDFYDDVIIAYDQLVGEVVDHLKKTGKYENTILVIYTDHDKSWSTWNRIPLMIHFPGDQYTGKITTNVQNLDIAPTILDYLQLPKPTWMGGDSLLSKNLDSHRLIFSALVREEVNDISSGSSQVSAQLFTPPFYQFSYINIIDCQNSYLLNLSKMQFSSGQVAGYTNPCRESSLLSLDEIKQKAKQLLTTDGFDTSSMP